MEDNIIEIEFSDIVKIANGLQEDGTPKSAGTLSIIQSDDLLKDDIEEMDEKNVKTVKEITLSTSSINMFVSGGCAVMDIDIPVQSSFEYRNMVDMCKKWLNNINDTKYDNQLLTFTVVPLLLEGQISIVYQSLVYYSGIQTEDGYKLILCFDNNFTNCYEIEGIDYEAIKQAIAEEIRMEEELLNQQILETEAEIKKLQDAENPYVQTINEGYKNDNLVDLNSPNEETPIKSGFRISKDE